MNIDQWFESLLLNLPKLHCWGGEWNYGGFGDYALRELWENVVRKLPEQPVIVETGAGLSTLMFLACNPQKLITVSIDPEGGLEQRIFDYARKNGFPADRLEYINDVSEIHLPRIAISRGLRADLCLSDGGHGWPTTFVDFCYMNMMLKKGGYLIVDDTQLFSVAQLALLLRRQPGWSVHHGLGTKTVTFKKETDERFLPDFGGQPYVLGNSLS